VFVEQETGKPVYSVESQNQISELIEAETWEQIVSIGYCDVKHNA